MHYENLLLECIEGIATVNVPIMNTPQTAYNVVVTDATLDG